MYRLICFLHLKLRPTFGEEPHLFRLGWVIQGCLNLKVSVRQWAVGLGAWALDLEMCISYLLLHNKLSPGFAA